MVLPGAFLVGGATALKATNVVRQDNAVDFSAFQSISELSIAAEFGSSVHR